MGQPSNNYRPLYYHYNWLLGLDTEPWIRIAVTSDLEATKCKAISILLEAASCQTGVVVSLYRINLASKADRNNNITTFGTQMAVAHSILPVNPLIQTQLQLRLRLDS